jgi:hypothetical protein
MYHLVVKRPSTPTGPRACMRPVLMPTYSRISKWFIRK